MEFMYAEVIAGLVVMALLGIVYIRYGSPRKARRFCVTLKQNEGVFIALRTEKHWDYWVFEKGQMVVKKPNEQSEPILGRIHVPVRNIAYYQELPNAVE